MKSNRGYSQIAVSNIYYQSVHVFLKHLYNHNEVLLTSLCIFTKITDDQQLSSLYLHSTHCQPAIRVQASVDHYLSVMIQQPFSLLSLGFKRQSGQMKLNDVTLSQAAHQQISISLYAHSFWSRCSESSM